MVTKLSLIAVSLCHMIQQFGETIFQLLIRPVISHFTRHNGVKKIGEKNALNGFVKMVNERIICTTIIKGKIDDHQGLFEKVVDVYNENFDDLNRSYRHHNLGGEMYCTHLR